MRDGKRRLFVIVYVGTVTVIHPHYIILRQLKVEKECV